MQINRTTLLMLLMCAAVLCACGLRGPLYLPDETPAAEPEQAQQADGGDEDKKENKKDGG